MNLKLKSLSNQVMVITGASSGIGLVTARLAATRGARVVLNARNEEALRRVASEINATGGEAIHIAGDVGKFDDVQNIADAVVRHFGGFDTWVNKAGVSIYGQVLNSRSKISAACLRLTIGEWCTVQSSPALICARTVAHLSTSAAFFPTFRFRFKVLTAPPNMPSKVTPTHYVWSWKKRALRFQ